MTSHVGSSFSIVLLACVASPFVRADTGWIEWQAWGRAGADDARVLSASPVFAQEPLRWARVTRFESARDLMENFVVRLRGQLTAPVNGDYVFHLETQGTATLRIRPVGRDEVAAHELAATRDGAIDSAPVRLTAGERYLLEAFHHGGEGPDSLRVGWTLPDGTRAMPLPAEHFTGVSAPAEIAAFNLRKAHVQPYTRSYDYAGGLARDRHNPKLGEHLTRETVYAAGAMLAEGRPEQVAEAIRALGKVLPLQDTSERSGSFGNWPKVVQRPGDFNAQNIGGFIGEELIIILNRHRDQLPPELVGKIEDALRRAALRGVRYDPPVTATNIVTKAVTVALLADRLLDIPAAREWGAQRLRELHAHTMEVGLPTEYNSPTYNRVAMQALGLLRAGLDDPELSPLVDDLYRATWREVALNYNPNLQLWTGPAARRYDDIHSPGALLQTATGNRLFFGEHACIDDDLAQHLPEEFAADFEPRADSITRSFPVLAPRPVARIIDQQSPLALTSTVHHAPTFSLGSFNRADLWDQRRPLIAFWGRRDAPGAFRITSPSGKAGLLAAQVNVLQSTNHLVAAVTFVTDAGWGKNPYDLHQADAHETPPIREVRVRFLTSGPAGGGVINAPRTRDGLATHDFPGGQLRLRLLAGSFGGAAPRWETTSQGLDLVLDAGRLGPLADLSDAAVAVAISLVTDPSEKPPHHDARLENGVLRLRLAGRQLDVPARPMPYAQLQAHLAAQSADPQ